jgi:hypothetical protein
MVFVLFGEEELHGGGGCGALMKLTLTIVQLKRQGVKEVYNATLPDRLA